MRNIQSTIDSSFQCTEDLRTGGRTGETHIEIASEWAFLTFDGFVLEFTASDVGGAFVDIVEFMFLQRSSSQQ